MLNFPQITIRTAHGRLILIMDGTVVKNSGGEPVRVDKDLKLLTIGPSVVELHPSEGSNTWASASLCVRTGGPGPEPAPTFTLRDNPMTTRRAILAERAVMWEERIQFDSGRGYWRHHHTERYTP